MPYNDLPSKLEEALYNIVFKLGVVGMTVATGASAETLEEPCIICSVQDSDEEAIKDSGVFTLRARISVRTSPDEKLGSLALHRSRVGQVFDAIITDQIAYDLRVQLADFHVYDVTFSGFAQEPRERAWATTINFDVVCCGSDIAVD